MTIAKVILPENININNNGKDIKLEVFLEQLSEYFEDLEDIKNVKNEIKNDDGYRISFDKFLKNA